MNGLFFDPNSVTKFLSTNTTQIGGTVSSFGSRHVIPCSGNIVSTMEHQPMNTSENVFDINLTHRSIIVSEIRSFFNFDISDQMVSAFIDVLNSECQTLKGHELATLRSENISTFIADRFKVRSFCFIDKLNSSYPANPRDELSVISLFKEFHLITEIAIKEFISGEYCPTTGGTNIFFRAGKYTAVEDEMGRCRKSILKENIFNPKTVNLMQRAYGVGLYSTPSLSAAMGYLQKPYNCHLPVTILAIFIKQNVNIISLNYDSLFHYFLKHRFPRNMKTIIEDIKMDKCYTENCIYIMPALETKCGYTLIKTPEIIEKVEPYDYTMFTKLHIPFTHDEISQYKMTPKTISVNEPPIFLKHDFIEVIPGSTKSYLPIYHYNTSHHSVINGAIEEHNNKTGVQEYTTPKDHKFFTIVDDINYEIRPSARPYEKCTDFSLSAFQFHVQYRPPGHQD